MAKIKYMKKIEMKEKKQRWQRRKFLESQDEADGKVDDNVKGNNR